MEIVQRAALSSHHTTLSSGLDCPRHNGRINQRNAGFSVREIPYRYRLNVLGLVTDADMSGRWQKKKVRHRVIATRSRKTEADKVQQEENEEREKGGGSSFLTFLCPLLKLLGGGDPAAPRNVFVETTMSGLASLSRLPWGSQVNAEVVAERAAVGQPSQLLQVYEFEACPFCRRVREALTELDLSAEIYPCPKGSLKHREFVKMNGGQEQFPYLIDPNTGVSMYESSEIVSYLFKQYGSGRKPSPGLLESTLVTGWVPTLLRAGRGMMLYPKASSETPPQKLELYSYENNQFARLVREALCELELPYILRNAGKGSALRDSLLKIAGSTQVPYLVDPNTGRSMAESKDIIAYLFATYGSKN
ncbi:hypothetical protein R1flu_003629 [Riccia fluitans]|uniref:GST N-terminal domain-containing protein n=1 Tax=Riccia fluitans TaxID=41844 RepID=A0ABD1YAI3_9MARC